MNPVVPAIESLATSFNSLGLWRGEQNVWGKRMNANTFDRCLYLWMHRLGFMGKAEQRLMNRLIRPGMTVVDVGANIGLYSLFLAGLVGPQGRVIAFEPDPDLVALLRANCTANGVGNVEAHHAALGSKADRLMLQRLTINSGENHLGSKGREAFRRPVEVDVAAFDALLPGSRPDFVKIDVQGWELNVLRGMEATLRESNPVVFVEFWPDGLRRAGSEPIELFSFVRDLGLDFYACDDGRQLSEAMFLDMAGRVKGMNYANLLASRGGSPLA
jgi:FkbM family methyltransferase